MLFYFACEAAGASAPGIPHALLGRNVLHNSDAFAPRECEGVTCRIVSKQSDEPHLSPAISPPIYLPTRGVAKRRVASLRVMPGRGDEALLRADVPAIHVLSCGSKHVDARHKAGHDEW